MFKGVNRPSLPDRVLGKIYAYDIKKGIRPSYTLFRKMRFEINFFVRQNASKFAIFIEKENPHSFFRFSFRAFLSFTL